MPIRHRSSRTPPAALGGITRSTGEPHSLPMTLRGERFANSEGRTGPEAYQAVFDRPNLAAEQGDFLLMIFSELRGEARHVLQKRITVDKVCSWAHSIAYAFDALIDLFDIGIGVRRRRGLSISDTHNNAGSIATQIVGSQINLDSMTSVHTHRLAWLINCSGSSSRSKMKLRAFCICKGSYRAALCGCSVACKAL